MTDLEMTKLCAEAMGKPINDYGEIIGSTSHDGGQVAYEPLHDDAQAFALVKQLSLHLSKIIPLEGIPWWHVQWCSQNPREADESAGNHDLNRAIVECVAMMQAAKQEE